MTTKPFNARDIKGFSPAIEPTQADSLFVLAGDGYIFDSLGPRSAFGNRLLLPQPLSLPQHAQSIRVKLRNGTRVFSFYGDRIWEWRENATGWRELYSTPGCANTPYRWTSGYLNGKLFLCHPRAGLLCYVESLDTFEIVDTPGAPQNPIAVAVSNGRLNCIDSEFLSWSAPSDGLNWNPTVGGAGFQRISDQVSGFPRMITSYANGVLTWTTGGVMRSEFTGNQFVYRHRPVNTEYTPVNSFCTARLNDQATVILDERGLFQSNGDVPTPFNPVFNEFLIGYIRDNNLTVGQNLRIEWDDVARLLYVSVSLTPEDPKYEKCFVLYPGLDKWGQFNESHYGIMPIYINANQRGGLYYGFVDSKARLRYWLKAGSRSADPDSDPAFINATLYTPPPATPVSESDNGRIGAATWRPSTQGGKKKLPGYYNAGSNQPLTGSVVGLGAKIQIGLLNFSSDVSNEDLSEVVAISLKTDITSPTDAAGDNYALVPPGGTQLVVGEPDFDLQSKSYVNHGLRLLGSLDGRTIFDAVEPTLVQYTKGMRYYACSVTGLYHIIELTADEPGESFHLQSFSMTVTSAGRL